VGPSGTHGLTSSRHGRPSADSAWVCQPASSGRPIMRTDLQDSPASRRKARGNFRHAVGKLPHRRRTLLATCASSRPFKGSLLSCFSSSSSRGFSRRCRPSTSSVGTALCAASPALAPGGALFATEAVHLRAHPHHRTFEHRAPRRARRPRVKRSSSCVTRLACQTPSDSRDSIHSAEDPARRDSPSPR